MDVKDIHTKYKKCDINIRPILAVIKTIRLPTIIISN